MVKDKQSIIAIELKDEPSRKAPHHHSLGCRIKAGNFEASFYNNVDERIMQLVLKEAAKHAR